jgi:hypothetical protein
MLVSGVVMAQAKAPVQVVKPPIAQAFIDLATIASDMPGAAMMAGAAQGGQSGSPFGALGGMLKGAVSGATGGGNTFGNTRAMGFGAPGKYVDISVFTVKNTQLGDATQAIPAGMNLGEALKLVAPISDKPVPTKVDEEPYEPSYEKPKGKISIYWGCGDTIRPGQPRTLDVSKASIEDYTKFFVMRGSTTKGARSQPGHPAWPNKDDDRRVPEAASLVGQHTFTGQGIPESFKVTLGATQDLLAPIELKQKKADGAVNLEWQSIPHARGYFISVMGGKASGGDSGEMIMWTSSELPDMGFGLVDYQSNPNVDKWLGEKVILPATTTQCTVPKGIFGEEATGMLRMIAYGAESFLAYPPRPTDIKKPWEPDWQTKVRTKSTLFSMLGGFGERGERGERGNAGKQAPKEDKKPNPVDLLKGLFGR